MNTSANAKAPNLDLLTIVAGLSTLIATAWFLMASVTA
jgi:hypothetical protein